MESREGTHKSADDPSNVLSFELVELLSGLDRAALNKGGNGELAPQQRHVLAEHDRASHWHRCTGQGCRDSEFASNVVGRGRTAGARRHA